MLGRWSGGSFEVIDAAAARRLVMDGWGAGGRVGKVEKKVRTRFFGLVVSCSVIDWGWSAGWRRGYHAWGGLLVVERMNGEVISVVVSRVLGIEF